MNSHEYYDNKKERLQTRPPPMEMYEPETKPYERISPKYTPKPVLPLDLGIHNDNMFG